MYKAEAISKTYDTLIIGSGIAGLLLAELLSSKGVSVLLACKGKLEESNTTMAQGGLAAVTGANPVDSPELHLQDTLSSGAGLTDEIVARGIASHGRQLVEMLSNYGVNWDKTNGAIDMALEGGHCRARVLHNKDASGRAITTSLIRKLRESTKVEIWEDAFALDLIVENEQVHGASILIKGTPLAVRAGHTVLATGGLGQLFTRTTNPVVATGDGIAMAYRAGARLIDMEFVQFHPTALAIPNKPSYLISEAVRGAGATLHDNSGRRFAFDFHKDGELATRDIVARAIYRTMLAQQSAHVWLDMRKLGASKIEHSFPNILKKCLDFGIDPREMPIPIAPAAHYFMGGVQADLTGKTSLHNLYAIGECASTGLHGANRLASNSLLEGGVMAIKLAEHIANAQQAASGGSALMDSAYGPTPLSRQALQREAFECIGLERNEKDLTRLLSHFEVRAGFQRTPAAPDRAQVELANLHLLAQIVAAGALARQESRGAHQRTEYPRTNDAAFLRRYWLTKEATGWSEVASEFDKTFAPRTVPVSF